MFFHQLHYTTKKKSLSPFLGNLDFFFRLTFFTAPYSKVLNRELKIRLKRKLEGVSEFAGDLVFFVEGGTAGVRAYASDAKVDANVDKVVLL